MNASALPWSHQIAGQGIEYGSKELIMHRNDELIIMGKQNQIDRFLRS